ncbi:MAG: alpha/beta fold hydrolase [Anaerovibrio sp.]|nr:alpha/beta fold hydrolase [Anaerovibrio sp.]
MILQGGEQFFFQGGRHGVLLVHGFTGSPAEMLLLGHYLHEQGYTVLGVRLAGHGTTPEDMARMSREDWYDSVCDGYSLLACCCSKISIVGQSMGGLLSLKLAANAAVHSAAVLGAPIFIHEDKKLYRLPPRDKCQGRYQPKRRRQISDVPDICNASYGEMPLLAVHELLNLIEDVKKELPRVSCPLLVMQSHNDHTVRERSADYIYRRAGSSAKKLYWLDRSGHLLALDCQRQEVFEQVGGFLLSFA